MAAVLACGAGAVLSHRSAADLHELRPTDREQIEVTVAQEATNESSTASRSIAHAR